MRCTTRSLMCKGAQVNLLTHTVWALTQRQGRPFAVRVTDALAVRQLGAGDISVVAVPRECEESPQLSWFEGSELPSGARRLVTSAARAVGADHLDRPLTNEETRERVAQLRKLSNRVAASFGGGTEERQRRAERLRGELDELALTRGLLDVDAACTRLIANKQVTSPAALLNALRQLPTMAAQVGADDSDRSTLRAAASAVPSAHLPSTASKVLAAVGVAAGSAPLAALRVELSDPRSVSRHAVLRFLERVEHRVDVGIVDAARELTRARAERLDVRSAQEDLRRLVQRAGITEAELRRVRGVIASLLTDTPGRSLDDPSRPVIVGWPASTGAVSENVVFSVAYEGRNLEIIARASRASGNPPQVALEVITLWEPSTVLESTLKWEDPSVPAELAEKWKQVTEDAIWSAVQAPR